MSGSVLSWRDAGDFWARREEYAQRPMLLQEDGLSITYGEADAFAEDFRARWPRRCLALLLAGNCAGAVLHYLACLRGGIVPVPVSPGLSAEVLAGWIGAYRPELVIAPEDAAIPAWEYAPAGSRYGYRVWEAPEPDRAGLHPDLALCLTTSGSTGSPKLVRQSYQNIAANAAQIAQYLQLDGAERPITTLPLHYTYGLSVLNSHLLVGATVLLTGLDMFDPRFWAFFRTARATSFGGVPYTYEMLERLRFREMRLPSLRTMTQAGGKLSPALHETYAAFARDTGRRFVVMYGQCEATARMAYLPPEDALRKVGSMGVAIPGGKLRLADDEGNAVTAPGSPGELIYEGPNVTMGYADRREDLALGDERMGTLETGDIAQFDGDGYCYIVGRKKRFLKLLGNRVNLDDLDRLVTERFGVEAASAGTDDALEIYVTGGDPEEILQFVSCHTKLHRRLFQVRRVAQLPRSASGKILYDRLGT